MRHTGWLSAVGLAALTSAAEIVYVTDLRIYTLLAPCAASALSENIALQTYSTRCGEGETELQSCICSNTALLSDVASDVSTGVTESCGSTADADVWSASKVMDQYCDPDATVTFSTPTTNIVNAYITELSELSYLAPCAQAGVSYAVMGAVSYNCPQDASLYAPCVCGKEGVVDMVTDALRSEVRSSCSNNEDVTSAKGFFSEYCAMNKGTTTFAVPDGPPGDMSYYITALPQFKALRSCAQDAVAEAVLTQASWMCPGGAQALASCVCLKSGLYYDVSSTLTSSVKYSCESTATDDVTSAVDVLKYFCSAANNEVFPEVTGSVSESYPVASTAATGSSPASPTKTGSGGGGDGDGDGDGGDSSGSSDGGESKGGSGGVSQTATIAASVLGAVVGLAIIAAIVFFIRRKNQKKKQAEAVAVTEVIHQDEPKPELDGSRPATGKPPTPSVAAVHPDLTSPVSPGTTQGGVSPIHDPRSELPGHAAAGYAMPYGQPVQEMAGQGYGYQPAPHMNGQQVQEFPAAPPGWTGQQAPGWQAGPLQSYELDSNHGRAI